MMKKPLKPSKPYDDFPLYAHAAGVWAKKIRGKLHYFGPWHDWRAALDKYLAQRDDLQAGREPRATQTGGATVRDLCNQFLTDKQSQVKAGELSERSFQDYKKTASRVIDAFGKGRRLDDLRVGDFTSLRASYPDTWGLTTLGNEINRVRVIFNYAGPEALDLVERKIAFGPMFKRPSAKSQRIERGKKPKKLFDAATIRAMIGKTDPTFRAMILLGINCGLGNRDCADLQFRHLDRDGWLNYPRGKTGVARRAHLWPETLEAIDIAVESRAKSLNLEATQSPSDRVFLTRVGRPYIHDQTKQGSCPISQRARRLLIELGLYRNGLTFYALRHTFQTIGERTGDVVAVSSIMGHVDSSMAGNYRETINDERLEKASRVVRDWLDLK